MYLDDADEKSASKNAKDEGSALKLQGMRIRDEFICPITFELFRDPVVASDGHTYEKGAIDKWLRTNTTSPRTGQPMERLILPNINMHRLIQDLIQEGGEGLYTRDMSDSTRAFVLKKEKHLLLQCLGPPECAWNMQSFPVTPVGCIGGRKPQSDAGRDIMLFTENTVSRAHFEITYNTTSKNYSIRDLGSAGGTFFRIPYGSTKELMPGMILLIGKHQFVVSSIDVASGANDADDEEMSIETLMGDAEELLAALENMSVEQNDGAASHRVRERMAALKSNAEKIKHCDRSFRSEGKGEESNRGKRCTLTCFAPDGSPMQGRSYVIDRSGATIGRRPSNSIAICSLALRDGAEKVTNIDNAVSQDHARIFMNPENESFYIQDGGTKASTNGTWFRLSGPHQESPPYVLTFGLEVLIGTVRFGVSERITIAEVDANSADSACK